MINIFLILVFFLPTQENSVITKLQNKFETIQYFQADFNQNLNEGGALKGNFYFSKENNYRIELKNNIIISDGKSIWNEDISRGKVIVSSIDDDPLAFSLNDYIYDYPSKCSIKEEKIDNGFLLTLTNIKSEVQFKSAMLWINNSYLLNKIKVTDFGGNSFTFHFSNIIVNKRIDNSLFTYKENSSNKIIDLR